MKAKLITQSKPDDLFVVKDVATVMLPGSPAGGTNSTAAAIEVAVDVPKVSEAVVCGHSQCAAMDALAGGLTQSDVLPHLAGWLEVVRPVLGVLMRDYQHLTRPAERATAAAAENEWFALENLRTYPRGRHQLEGGWLHLHGRFFKIASAERFAYDPEAHQFAPLVTTESGKL